MYHVDVFTSVRFGGNPLAVFLDADGLDERTMQIIAREMNLSESTFVLRSPGGADARVRIFTPGKELAFAGHPTLGTAFVLQQSGRAGDQLEFEMKAGIIPVRREGDVLWMTPPPGEASSDGFDAAAVARALGLPESSVIAPPRVFGGGGMLFLCVPIDSREQVDRIRVDRRALIAATDERVGTGDVLAANYHNGEAYTRMFADLESGIIEDPATGSSIAPLHAALVSWHLLEPSRTEFAVEQGVAMGRPSTLLARFTTTAAHVQGLAVGGSCVGVYESLLDVD
jgi:trans-2,3-dihydro-3-hydroxyanthranilate isomerase